MQDPNILDGSGATALHLAALNKSHLIVQALLDAGAQPNVLNYEGVSVFEHVILSRANSKTKVKMMESIVASGGDLDIYNRNGLTLSTIAVKAGDVDVYEYLSGQKISPNNTCDGQSPVDISLNLNNTELLLALVKSGYIDTGNKQNEHVHYEQLVSAVLADEDEEVSELLIRGLHLLGVDFSFAKDILIGQINKGKENTAILLAEENIDLNITDEKGRSLLILAIQRQMPALVKFLLKRGVDSSFSDDAGRNAGHYAAILDDTSMLDLLIKSQKFEIDRVDDNGLTALHYAAYKAKPRSITHLINAGIDYHIKDDKGRPAILFSDIAKRRESISTLLRLIKTPDALSYQNLTILEYAVKNDRRMLFEEIIKSDYVLEVAGDEGVLAANYAILAGAHEILERLVRTGINLNRALANEDSPMLTAARWGSVHDLSIILDNGGNSDVQGLNGRTALHLAVLDKSISKVGLLLNLGSNINVKDDAGFTPLDYADQNHLTEISGLIRKKSGS